MLAVLMIAGAALHDLTTHSLLARLLWLGGVVAVIGYPLHYLLGFRCPRCGALYLATGRLADFLGLGRVLWARHCGNCSLQAGHAAAGLAGADAHPASSGRSGRDVPDSRPAARSVSKLS
jgi:hypothetical protein